MDFRQRLLAAGGTLGILIPPSIVLVIYAILTEQNIAKLFLAAFIPGILAAMGYMLTISIYVRLHPDSAGTRPRVPYSERFKALIAVLARFAGCLRPVVGGIYQGLVHARPKALPWAAFGTGLIALFGWRA